MESTYRGILLILSLLVSYAGFCVEDSLRTEVQNGQYYVIHQVEEGETLYSLTRRYKSEMRKVIEVNNIVDNTISLDQILKIPIAIPENPNDKSKSELPEPKEALKKDKNKNRKEGVHEVAMGETLFSISRKYGVTVDDLKTWNNLSGNELSIGQELNIRKKKQMVKDKMEPVAEPIPEGYKIYLVQSGDLLETIAAKYGVRPDSIVIWNDLPNTYLKIGQKLLIKSGTVKSNTKPGKQVDLGYGIRRTVKDQSGFIKVYEEGTARKIEEVSETDKYLALHRDLKIGTLIEVRNLMNNQKIFVRVIGKLPNTGLNENVLLRLTPICFERLGVIDPKTRVEVSYYQD